MKPTTSPSGILATWRRPLPHKLLPIIVTLLAVLLTGFAAPPARASLVTNTPTLAPPAQMALATDEPDRKPEFKLTKVRVADPMHIPILMYRHRHTMLQEDVSWWRNVAAFDFYPSKGVRLIIVAPSIPKKGTKTAIIDVYRENEATGEWTLVDLNGEPIIVNGQAADWRNTLEPSLIWDLSAEPDLTPPDGSNFGLHSEPVASLALERNANGANETTKKGFSERITCPECSPELENETWSWDGDMVIPVVQGWFPELDDMKFVTDQPSPGQNQNELQSGYKDWVDAGKPTGTDAAAKVAKQQGVVTPGSPGPEGAVGEALAGPCPEGAVGKGLAVPCGDAPAGGTDPGGIDFSTLDLRYLSEGSDGQLAYAFAAEPGNGSASRLVDGQTAVVQSADAFFVWLSLPESTFWVNLNPNEPDRIVDAKLGTTDVGRILLEADLQMKRDSARLIHPDSETGRLYWGEAGEAAGCTDLRQWIVPKPATVYEQDGGLYIVDAPLEVKMEADFLRKQGQPTKCTSPDAGMTQIHRTLVLPKVEEAVNQAPEYAELRRVYLSRVAAEWYRQRHSHDGALSSLINTGNVSAWPALKRWSPRQVFDQYVESYQKGEFNITRRETREDGWFRDITYWAGGVDFSKVEFNKVTQTAFEQQHPGLTNAVQRSIQQRATDQQGKVWLGSTSRPVPVFDASAPLPPTSNPWFYPLMALPLAIWLVVGILLLRRRRGQLVRVEG
ncbi:hypothetical protein [Sinomonas mesophila]|uniref:hypothetical protein n=1 Tax=Sinomonas mesophila TaxID=1531955 RepID=UPI000984AE48|nr:hypothetical protein [Sinomonas mesophila]